MRIVRFLYIWKSPRTTFALTLLAGAPFILLALLTPVLIITEPVEYILGLISDTRALETATLQMSEITHPFILSFVWIADHFQSQPGKVLLWARGFMALLALFIFAVFTARRLPLWPSMLLGIIVTLMFINPYMPLENLLLFCGLILAFGFLIAPVEHPNTKISPLTIIVESTIASVLFLGLASSSFNFFVLAVIILTLSAFSGGAGRGQRYFCTLAISGFIILIASILSPSALEITKATHYTDSGLSLEKINFAMLWSGFLFCLCILVFGARSTIYPLLFNHISVKGTLLGTLAALIAFSGLSITCFFAFDNVRAQYQVQAYFKDQAFQYDDQNQYMTTAKILMENYAMVQIKGISTENSWLEKQGILVALLQAFQNGQDFTSKNVAILTESDIACVMPHSDNSNHSDAKARDCFGDGFSAIKVSDIVLVPKMPFNQPTQQLIKKSEGILYSEFKHVEESDFWDVWKRKN